MRGPALLTLLAAVLPLACSSGPVASPPASSTAPGATAGVPGSVTTATEPTEPAGVVVVPDGFERVQATVTEPDGTVCEVCLWLADDADRRRRGLMFVTDLGPADGMAFVYPSPHRGSFWMKNTLLPLSIAFFAPDGTFLEAFDMAPCTDDPCPVYPTPDDFLIAVETVQGGLGDLGIGAGSVLDLTDLPCEEP